MRTFSVRAISTQVLCLSCLLLTACNEPLTEVDYLTRAQVAIQQQDANTAIIELKNAIKAAPENLESKARLGHIYYDKGMLAFADKELTRATAQDAPPQSWLLTLARTRLQMMQFDSARITLRSVEQWQPEFHADAIALIAQSYLLSGNPEEGEKHLIQASKLNPEANEVNLASVILLNQKEQYKAALTTLNTDYKPNYRARQIKSRLAIVNKEYQQAANILTGLIKEQAAYPMHQLDLATAYIYMEDYTAAENNLTNLLKLSPKNALANHLMSRIELYKENFEASMRHADTSLASLPDFIEAHFVAAIAAYQLSQPEKALSHIDKVLFNNPELVTALKLRSAIYLSMGKRDQAVLDIARLDEKMFQQEDEAFLLAAGNASLLQGNIGLSEKLFRTVTDLVQSETAELSLASLALVSGNPHQAIDSLSQALQQQPDSIALKLGVIVSKIKGAQWQQAKDATEHFLKEHPELPDGYNLKGMLLGYENKLTEAEQLFDKALEIEPGYVSALQNLARLALRQNNQEKARQLHEQVFELDKTDLVSLLHLAQLAFAEKDMAKGTALLEQAVKGNPNNSLARLSLAKAWLHQGLAEKAAILLAPLRERFPNHVQVLWVSALAEELNNNTRLALEIMQQLETLLPENHDVAFHIASLHKHHQDYQRALDYYLPLAQKFPENLKLQLQLIETLTLAGKTAQAQQHIARLEDSPHKTRATARLYLEQKEFAKAAGLYQSLQSDSKGNQDMIRQAVIALIASGQKNQAKSLLSDWLKSKPDDNKARLQYAQIYLQEGDLNKAREQYLIVTNQDDQQAGAFNNLAWILLQQNQYDEALDYAQRAKNLMPGDANILDTLAMAYHKKGDSTSAQKLLKDATDINPGNLNIQFHLALVMADNGHKDKARQILNQLLNQPKNFATRRASEELLMQLN